MTTLLTSAEVAELLGVTVSYVHQLNREGQLPHAQKLTGVRGAKLFDPVVVADMKAQRAGSPS